MDETYLTNEQIDSVRKKIVMFAVKLLDVPYEYGAEWTNYNEIPKSLDCSELLEGCYNHFGLRLPDGSQNQFFHTKTTTEPKDADLAFFGRGGKENQIYHVGMIYGEHILEARGLQPRSSFETGKVILRPRERWETYKNFAGYRAWPKLLYRKKPVETVMGERWNNVA